ncbi:hypothetical protein AB2M62_11840 [Sphingomonas sp. MMS12-HWE2-04]|uniref:hypothetical protein n=1 Tax=Sphingomonas sp. MMS12-HWE2-04 TaxID=3234199 RepID=UPI00384A5D0E
MSFREKIAWVAFLSTVIAWGGYFAVVVHASINGADGGLWLLWLFIGVTIAQAVVLGVATAVAAILDPADAQAARDERDFAVGRRASGIAYGTLVAGLIAVIAALHVGLHGRGTIFALLGLFMLGEATRYGAQAIGYRRTA